MSQDIKNSCIEKKTKIVKARPVQPAMEHPVHRKNSTNKSKTEEVGSDMFMFENIIPTPILKKNVIQSFENFTFFLRRIYVANR